MNHPAHTISSGKKHFPNFFLPFLYFFYFFFIYFIRDVYLMFLCVEPLKYRGKKKTIFITIKVTLNSNLKINYLG
jgi:hypothetical protein